jgi:multidrug efflux system outer membrane protein
MGPIEAALEAARLRLRPILMTSLAFILGVMPLAISNGAGSASQHAIGTGVIGGMITATFLAIFMIPMFFVKIRAIFSGEKEDADEALRYEAHHAHDHDADNADNGGSGGSNSESGDNGQKDTDIDCEPRCAAAVPRGCTMAPPTRGPTRPSRRRIRRRRLRGAAGVATGDLALAAPMTPPRPPSAGATSSPIRACSGSIEIALNNNRDLRVAVLNVEASRAQYQITRAGLFPRSMPWPGHPAPAVAVTSRASRYSVYNVGLQASWEIDFWGRIRSLKDQALAQYLSTAYARKAAEISLVSQVADQYLTLLSDEDLLKVTEDTLKTAQDSYDLTKLQFDTGTGTELDLRQAQTVVEQAQANLQAQLRARAQAVNALVLLIGEPLPEDLPPACRSMARPCWPIFRRGSVGPAYASPGHHAGRGRCWRRTRTSARRERRFPAISLTAAFGTESLSLGGLFKAGSTAWSFVPQITLPIFEGGANIANLQLANVEKRIEIASYEKAIQSAFREVADGLAARGTYDQQIAALERNTLRTSARSISNCATGRAWTASCQCSRRKPTYTHRGRR